MFLFLGTMVGMVAMVEHWPHRQELKTNQEAMMTDFDDAGLSATVQFTSRDAPGGSMTTYLVRGMVSRRADSPAASQADTWSSSQR